MTERPNIALMSEVQKEALIMALWEELEQIKQENAQLKQQHAQDQSRLEQLKQLEQQQNQEEQPQLQCAALTRPEGQQTST